MSNKDLRNAKTIGICAHSYEGGALCFLTACREGAKILGPHMHPNVVVSAIAMGLSMPGYENNDDEEVAAHLKAGVAQVAKAGAHFFICPDNTAHIILEKVVHQLPLPGLHIADVVCSEIAANGWNKVALLGTNWTMTGPVYEKALASKGLKRMIPKEAVRMQIHNAIFDELCQGVFKEATTNIFTKAIEDLKNEGAECVILGCTEIPIIVNTQNSALPIIDTTRLLAKYAVRLALADVKLPGSGWIDSATMTRQTEVQQESGACVAS